MFSCVEMGTAAVGCETACCRSGLCRRVIVVEVVVEGRGMAEVEEEVRGVVVAVAAEAPSRWFTVDRLGGARTVVRRAISAGTGLVVKLELLEVVVMFASGIVASFDRVTEAKRV